MLIEPVSYRSRKRECLGNFFPSPESFRHAQSGRIANAKRDQMNRKLMTLLASCVLVSSISVFDQDDAKQDGMQKEETKQNEMKHDSMANDSMKRDQMTEGQETEESPQVQEVEQQGRNGQRWDEARRQHEAGRQYTERRNAALSLNGALAYLSATQPNQNTRLRASDHTTIKGEVNHAGNAER